MMLPVMVSTALLLLLLRPDAAIAAAVPTAAASAADRDPSFETRSTSCPPGYFACQSNYYGDCILNTWVCDGEVDCYDGEDEVDCDITSTTVASPTSTTVASPTSTTVASPTSTTVASPTSTTVAYPTSTTVASPTSTSAPGDCPIPYQMVADRCLVLLFSEEGWNEMNYMCSEFGGDLLEVTDANFFYQLLTFIKENGLEQHDYWINGRKDLNQTQYYWAKSGEFLPVGSPFWAINESVVSTLDPYDQDPSPIIEDQRVFLKKDRALYFSAASPSQLAGAICQRNAAKIIMRTRL